MIVPAKEARLAAGGKLEVLRVPRKRACPRVDVTIPLSVAGKQVVDGREVSMVEEWCRVHVLAASQGWLDGVTRREANLYGFRFRDDFMEAWFERWGVKRAAGLTPVHVVEIRLVTERRPRYLSRGVVAFRQGDYVHDPSQGLEDAGEALSPEELERFAEQARLKDEELAAERAAAVREMPLDDQVHHLSRVARARHVDVRSELRAVMRFRDRPELVQKQVAAMRRKLGLERVA